MVAHLSWLPVASSAACLCIRPQRLPPAQALDAARHGRSGEPSPPWALSRVLIASAPARHLAASRPRRPCIAAGRRWGLPIWTRRFALLAYEDEKGRVDSALGDWGTAERGRVVWPAGLLCSCVGRREQEG